MNRTFKIYAFNMGNGTLSHQSVINTSATIKPSGLIPAYGVKMYDAILFMITCKTHKKVLLKDINKKGVFYLPFFPLKLYDSWKDQITYYLGQIIKGNNFKTIKNHLLQVNQIRLVRYCDYLLQLVMTIEIDNCSGQCNASENGYKWYSISHVTMNEVHFWSPEPYLYLNRSNRMATCNELSIGTELKANSKRWTMAQSIGYNESDVEHLYANYLQHCYPAQFMNEPIFLEYLRVSGTKLMVNSSVASNSRLYNSFCAHTGSHITFKDFLLTMVALDRKCLHGGTGGELRTRCLFRYYSKFGANSISFQELVSIFVDIGSTPKGEKETPEMSAKKIFQKENLDKQTQSLSMDKFIELVGNLVIRGTASIYRSTTSPLTEIRTRKIYAELWPREMQVERLIERRPLPLKRCKACYDCNRDCRLGIHSLSFTRPHGPLTNFQEIPFELTIKFPRSIRERSLDSVNSQHACNLLLDTMRRFSSLVFGFPFIEGSPATAAPKWEQKSDRAALVEKICKVCNDAKEAFKKTPRMIKVASPVYVFGDIHGNLKDLMIYDHQFWRMAPLGFVASCLFLGDYVDRGDYSVECIIYLMCMKLLLPERIFLLRGNHEIRSIQKMFTFFRECIDKFGPTGNLVWETFNQVFDYMPICGIIDEQVFCAHGGIPTSASRVETLYNIPLPLPSPNGVNKPAWEVLWNDPVTRKEYRDYSGPTPPGNRFLTYPPGFLPNTKRGTAFYYSDDAINTFLEINDLSFVIRAHEVRAEGFTFHMDGKMMTVFSCSDYCGSGNQSSVVFIEDNKMRVIKIETFKDFQEFTTTK